MVFRNVAPSDWAYTALNDLIQRYNCLQGYPNGTFQGQRPLSRYEFAAGLNACANTLETLLTENTDFVTRADLETLRNLDTPCPSGALRSANAPYNSTGL